MCTKIKFLVLTVSALMLLSQTPSNAALVQQLTFDGNLNDSVGAYNGSQVGNNPLPQDTVDKKEGTSSQMIYGRDVPNRVDAPLPAGLDSGSSSWTLAFWFKYVQTQDPISGAYYRFLDGNTGGGENLKFVLGLASYGSYHDVAVYSSTAGLPWANVGMQINTGQWYHMAYAYDGATLRFSTYLDGVQKYSQVMAAAMDRTGITALSLSSWLGGPTWGVNSKWDDYRTYNTALSASEVAAIVPEPATLAILGLGGLVLRRMRKA